MKDCPITRRESIKRLLWLSGGLAFTGMMSDPFHIAFSASAEPGNGKFIVEAIGQTDGYSIRMLTRKLFETVGGIQQFVSRQDIVAVKPNLSWARAPHLAATTNPEVLAAVIELCQEAGAKKVRIVDNTIHDPRRCFALTGAGAVAKKTGADLIFPRPSLMREMKIHGNRLDVWPVYVPVVEADKIINLPVAKVHVLSDLTLGMKNWIGAVGGRRSALHQDIHHTVADLARFFKPTLTLIDAIRIMTANGPSGGSESDVVAGNRLILSNDPVAADARAAMLFNRRPEDIGYIRLGQAWGVGTFDFKTMTDRKVVV